MIFDQCILCSLVDKFEDFDLVVVVAEYAIKNVYRKRIYDVALNIPDQRRTAGTS